MSRSLNRVQLLGNLGKGAELKYTSGGVPCVRFPMATEHRYKKGDEWVSETQWHNVILWRNEKIVPYLTKGARVYVEGRLQTRGYEDKDDGTKRYSTEVVCEDVILWGGGNGKSSAPQQSDEPEQPIQDDEDVPF